MPSRRNKKGVIPQCSEESPPCARHYPELEEIAEQSATPEIRKELQFQRKELLLLGCRVLFNKPKHEVALNYHPTTKFVEEIYLKQIVVPQKTANTLRQAENSDIPLPKLPARAVSPSDDLVSSNSGIRYQIQK